MQVIGIREAKETENKINTMSEEVRTQIYSERMKDTDHHIPKTKASFKWELKLLGMRLKWQLMV